MLLALLLAASPAIDLLNQSVAWYRAYAPVVAQATEPGDVVFAADGRQDALEILKLSFETARALTALSSAPAADGPAMPDGAALAQRFNDAVAQVDAAKAKVAQGGSPDQLAEARAELDLAEAREDTLKSMVAFQPAGGGQSGQIDELERSIPELRGAAASKTVPAPVQVSKAPPNGVLGLISDVLTLSRKLSDLHAVITGTSSLHASLEKLRAPLAADLDSTARLSPASGATAADRTRALLQATAHYKKVAAALLPLSRDLLLLDSFRANLNQWHDATDHQNDVEIRGLLLRLSLLLLAIFAILAASDFWRRATFRYVQDLHRRHQFLLVRRIVVAAVVSLFIVFALVTEVGSIATFAGFITAGLAVALQNVILSVAAYFFLIGKYGVRVGDRVQVSGVTGDVIDIGLVRLHLMEVGSGGQSTGRVVVFSNSFVFQPNSTFFKQLPGSNFSWHQLKLTLSAGTDYKLAEQRMQRAVESVYSGYRETIDRQHRDMSEALAVRVEAPKPQSQLRFSSDGLEILIRYPAPLAQGSAIDDAMTRAIVDAVALEPKLSLAFAGAPTIQEIT
jgi:small-conductance mechanosensitive channel